jgi:catechol 2,3-dioxygenase-like lactoylglutathione lyase family enzyme
MTRPQLTGVIPRLPVADLARTVRFYTGVLGFQISLMWPEKDPTFAVLDRDAVSLGFFTPDAHRGAVTIGTADLYLGADDVLGLHAAIRDQVTVEWGPEVYFYGRREFAVRDPDGYLLIFTEPTDDPPTAADA